MNDFLFTGKVEKTDDSTLSDISPMSSGVESGQQSPVSPEHKKNQKGIRKLWGKWVFEGFLLVEDRFQKKHCFIIWCIFKLFCILMEISVGQNFHFILQDMIVSWWPVILLATILFLQLFLVCFTGSGEHSQAVFLQTLLILTLSEGVSGPRPALDSPAWPPVATARYLSTYNEIY